jgi:indole-3-glycerol phosphate synthase
MILDEIIAQKRAEVAALRDWFIYEWGPPVAHPRRDFAGALKAPGLSLIAEFKRRSPSKGELGPDADPARAARAYEAAGAAAVSVLTDARFFGGSMGDLEAARAACSLPVLRKDFIIDPAQIAQSAGAEGPDCLLVIASVLTAWELRDLRSYWAADCGQAALVEVHNELELERALESGAEMIGINNRDLRTFEVSLETTLRLRPRIPAGIVVVSESGVHTRGDVQRLEEAGVDAILVGEALMTSDDPRRKVEELMGR